MAASLPVSLKPVQHYLKTATEHDKRDPVVAYYCRIYALQKGMELDKKSAEGRTFLLSLMDSVENQKKELKEQESISSEVVGQAHVENYALKLFLYADNEDRAARFGKNVVKSFYTAGMLLDVLTQFGELSEDLEKNRKYAKWKAAYIHNCLKNGETPHSGPLDEEEDGVLEDAAAPPPIGFSDPGQGFHQPQPPQQPGPSAYIPPTQPQLPQVPPNQPRPFEPGPHQPSPHQAPVPAARLPAATPTQPSAQTWTPPVNPGGVNLTATDYQKAIKLCKYATSALQYEDSPTAINNLTKALNLLATGHE